MRNIVFIGMLLAAAFMAGWFKIQRDGENTLIEINRAAIRDDAQHAIEKSRQILDRSQQRLDNPAFAETQAHWPAQPSSPWPLDSQPAPLPYDPRSFGPQYPDGVPDYAAGDQRVSSPGYAEPPYSPPPYSPPPYSPPSYSPLPYSPSSYASPAPSLPPYSGDYSAPSVPVSPVQYPSANGPYTQLPSYPQR